MDVEIEVILLVVANETYKLEIGGKSVWVLFVPQTEHARCMYFIIWDLPDYNFLEMFKLHHFIFLVEEILEYNTTWICFLLHSFENHNLLIVFVGHKMQDSFVCL